LVDLSAGLGVDDAAFSKKFNQIIGIRIKVDFTFI
jgi:hypothetical protein